MRLFRIMKQALSNTDPKDWHTLTEVDEVEQLIEASKNKPQLVYKHSHTCSICFVAKKEVEDKFEAIKEKADMHFVNVIKSRPVSSAVAENLGVRHESPQVLIIDQGKCVWHKTHWSIK